MAYTTKMFAYAPQKAYTGNLDWDGNTINCALFTDAYTPNQQTDILYSALANQVANGNGYLTGGVVLASKTNAVAALVTSLGAANCSWAAATFTAKVAVVYDANTSALLGYVDFGANQSVVAGTFTIAWAGGVVANVTVS